MSPQNHTIKGESTIQEIAVKHGVHPNQVSQWKSQAIAGMKEIWNCRNISWQESFQGQQIPQEVSVTGQGSISR